jgi:hypothetical protein
MRSKTKRWYQLDGTEDRSSDLPSTSLSKDDLPRRDGGCWVVVMLVAAVAVELAWLAFLVWASLAALRWAVG